jgi:redox-sensitive bicupin YhaK (pirin superfamily)
MAACATLGRYLESTQIRGDSPVVKSKQVVRVQSPPAPHWVGDGFHVRSIFSYHDDPAETSPFLLCDYGAPMEFEPSASRRGVGPHPHRGFETVTIAFQGEVEHRDSVGNHGRIGPGDVQWMTAASGILHEELQGREFAKKGGFFEMAQVWVNLPAKDKMSPPHYQDIVQTKIPTVELADGAGSVRVIAGEFRGAKGPARTFTPVEMWELRVAAGHTVDLELPEGHTSMLLVTRGKVVVNETSASEEHLVVLSRAGAGFRVRAEDQDARILVMGGQPIEEPVVGYGPFVMNTWDEISRANHDFQAGRMGTLRSSMEGE